MARLAWLGELWQCLLVTEAGRGKVLAACLAMGAVSRCLV